MEEREGVRVCSEGWTLKMAIVISVESTSSSLPLLRDEG